MIWTIIGVIILMVGIALSPIRKIVYDKTENYRLDDTLENFQIGLVIIGALWCTVCFILISLSHTVCNTEAKINLEERKASIEAALNDKNFEGEADINVRNYVYDDIKEYNTLVRKAKHQRASLWTNWFTVPCIEDFEVIEYEEIDI